MAYKSLLRSDAVARYVNVDMLHEKPVQKRLREQTAAMPNGQMQISADQGAFLQMLVRLIEAQRVLEIGTFTGYSAMSFAYALPADGRVVACDISEEWTSVARQYWREAGVDNKIELRLGPAQATLEQMVAQGIGASAPFDLCFIDADKEAYETYYELALKLVRPGGLVVMDNVMGGRGSGGADFDPVNSPMHALNMKIRADTRVEAMIVTVAGGLMVVRKK